MSALNGICSEPGRLKILCSPCHLGRTQAGAWAWPKWHGPHSHFQHIGIFTLTALTLRILQILILVLLTLRSWDGPHLWQCYVHGSTVGLLAMAPITQVSCHAYLDVRRAKIDSNTIFKIQSPHYFALIRFHKCTVSEDPLARPSLF